MAWRLIIRSPGGPEAIEREEFDPGSPGPGEVLIAQEAVGLNFIDTYVRSGLYPAALPTGLGDEAAGTVAAVGPGVAALRVGDRVGYVISDHSSYATHRLIPADKLLKLPEGLSCEVAAATMLKGMTACFLAEDCARMQAGQSALVHAAAGGVGSILVPWLRDLGVNVIAHSGSEEKATKAQEAGATHSLCMPLDQLSPAVRGLTDGRGVDVVFDGVGKASWAASIASLRPRGLMVSFGNASGPVPPVSLLDLSRAGSLFVTRPMLFHYIADPRDYHHMGERLFDRIARGVIKADIGQRFPLSEAAQAHRALESRTTTGSTVLVV